MADSALSHTLAEFEARVQNTKNRLIAIPSAVQRQLDLRRQKNNFIARVSLRPHDGGRWNHHYVKLTFDNEFAIPSDVTRFQSLDVVDVRIPPVTHRLAPGRPPCCEAPRRRRHGHVLHRDAPV